MDHVGDKRPMTISPAGRAGRHRRLLGAGECAGFSLVELVVLVAVIGVMFSITIPFFLSYYRVAAVKAASQEVVALLNQARQLAIQSNSTLGVCVNLPSSSEMQFIQAGCGGTVWIGPGTTPAGRINLPQGFTMGPATDVTFNYLGAAQPAVTYTVTNTATGATLTVRVAISGRISTP
jgi:Tfp pilus assembly protein FimT